MHVGARLEHAMSPQLPPGTAASSPGAWWRWSLWPRRSACCSAGLSAGPPLPIRQQARRRSPGGITQIRNRSALASGLMRIGW